MTKHIVEILTITETDLYHYELARHLSLFDGELKRRLAEMTSKSLAEIERIFNDAALLSYEFHKPDYNRKEMPFVPINENKVIQQITNGYKNQAITDFKNLTQTVGFTTKEGKFLSPRNFFTNRLSQASFNVSSGIMDYNAAIKRTVRELRDSGLKQVEYPHAKPYSLVTSVRMNVLTSIGQLSGAIEDYNGEQLGFNLVETSAHTSSRESHRSWQGRRFSIGGDGTIADMRRRVKEVREADAGVRAMRKAERNQ
jgi:hypothetical protein